MSTAKSMATSYLNGKRTGQQNNKYRFKSSTSNLASATTSNNNNSRLKATSMTNLIADQQQSNSSPSNNRIQRPASRNALDSIHNGMNAKYAQIQSKVLLQNIRPAAASMKQDNNISKSKSNTLQSSNYGRLGAGRQTPSSNATGSNQFKVPSDRTQLINKIKALQEEVDKFDDEKENFKQELEREKSDKNEQIQQLKQELQDKLADHDKQHEEYHQKLLEAYELADQNRRAADNVLNESRQREEESRKKIEDLENQLTELKEFVTMKEEMTTKMFELREQIREERERYEEQLKSLHQVFENEKLRHAELGDVEQIVKSNKSNIETTARSNYFKRMKPSLQSNESLNNSPDMMIMNQTAMKQCKHCYKLNSKHAQLHRSEHDIYGSKLSTRMHDTARSAWKASKQFASSVITGSSVGISACRKRTTTLSATATATETKQSKYKQSKEENCRQAGVNNEPKAASINDPAAADFGHNHQADDDEQHTSVVKVESSAGQQQQQQSQSIVSINVSGEQNHLIRVDENNKLTIVTKFSEINDSSNNSIATSSSPNGLATSSPASSMLNQHQQHHHHDGSSRSTAPAVSPATANGSERSRCESSSSGRGTSSSDAGSSASQNGDAELIMQTELQQHNSLENSSKQCSVPANINNDSNDHSETITTILGGKEHKQHRRKSSLFKASSVFGNAGSQVSLNKLKYFFTGSHGSGSISHNNNNNYINGNKLTITPLTKATKHQHDLDASIASEKHLENSRLRCMELNRAINMPSPAVVLSKQAHVDVTLAKQEECTNNNNNVVEKEEGKLVDGGKQMMSSSSPSQERNYDKNDGEKDGCKKFVGQGEEEEEESVLNENASRQQTLTALGSR